MTDIPVQAAESGRADPDAAVAPSPPPANELEVRKKEAQEGPQRAEEMSAEAKWRDRAQRLQAEMENYRKRQRRLAAAQIADYRQRTLSTLLRIVDDLSRALNAHQADAASLRQGVEMTYRNLKQALDREGVEHIQARGETFDPRWHEAVSTVSHQDAGVEPNTVVDVMEEGYRLGERVLRPARVVVAT